jgi:hypothetical protein
MRIQDGMKMGDKNSKIKIAEGEIGGENQSRG